MKASDGDNAHERLTDIDIRGAGTARSIGSANLAPTSQSYVAAPEYRYRDGHLHLSDREFVAWLAMQRHGFEDDVDRKVEAWRHSKAWRQAEAWRRRRS